MATINICGLTPIHDPAYRYKMPRIVGKVEGRGNGIKTVLMNVKEVADSLKREAPEVTKFFGCEFGAQTQYSEETDRAIVNGAHRDQDLQSHLHKYIEHFVLCRGCKLPETHYKVKDGLVSQKCIACGHKEAVDMTHKLTTFILNAHKKNKESKKGEKGEKDKDKEKDKKKKDKDRKDESADGKADGEGEGSSSGKEKKKKDKEGKKSSKTTAVDEDEAVGKNVFGIEAPADGAGAAAEEDDEDDLKAAEEAMGRFSAFLASHPAHPAAPPVAEQVEFLRELQTILSLRPADRVIIFLGAVFGEDCVAKNSVEAHREILAALAPTPIQQRHLIGGLEWLCGSKFPALSKFFPKVLMQLYEADLVEEDVFLQWGADTIVNEFSAQSGSTGGGAGGFITYEALEALRTAAAPFLTWLEEAEEEGEDDEEDDEEEA